MKGEGAKERGRGDEGEMCKERRYRCEDEFRMTGMTRG